MTIIPKEVKENEKILDIGGGGEGIISRIYKSNVTAIDNRKDELKEISDTESLKIVMDATVMAFIDHQFDRATAFFSFMYMHENEIIKSIMEVHRVLKKNGSFEIWDIEMPSGHQVKEDFFIVQLEVISEDLVVNTGYGVQLKEVQSLDTFLELLKNNGFTSVISKSCIDNVIYIEVKK
ncbi:MAG: hypothetical protein BGO41_15305 [Clostridiales bacterium 38-18]|nr:MAG: hypothetical protein BGO41_15305 [Clostridiales bacterium 38-18]